MRIGLIGMLLAAGLPGLAQKPLAYSSIVPFPSFVSTAGAPVIADFNGDGKLDVILTPGNTPGAAMELLLGNGDGTFRPGPQPPGGSGAFAAATGDVNGDGKPDLAVCSAVESFNSATLTIFVNQGNGTFRQTAVLPANCEGSVIIADLNHDGKADIYDSGSYEWFGNGDGTFGGRISYKPALPYFPQMADFNGDGLPDLADITNFDTTHQAGIWFNHGSAGFDLQPTLAVSFTTPFGTTNSDSLAAGDFNGDGKPDLALLTPEGGLHIYLNEGSATFRAGAVYTFPRPTIGLYAHDMDGDGKADLVMTTGQIEILRGHGDGTFAEPVNLCSGGTLGVSFDIGGNNGALLFGDFNGDGVLDMIDYPTAMNTGPGTTTLLLSGVSSKPVIQGGPVSSATFASGPVSSGSIVTIFGERLGTAACSGIGEEVLFNGIPAGIVYAGPSQINAEVPWELAGASTAQVIELNNGNASEPVTVEVAAVSPAIFTLTQNSAGPGAIVPAGTHQAASATNPARRGQYATIYTTGLGPVSNQPLTGDSSPIYPLAQTTFHPTVTVGSLPATVSFSGLSPYYVGLYQINFKIPENAPTGAAVPVLISIDGVLSNTVTMPVE